MAAELKVESNDLDALLNAAEAIGDAARGDDARLVMGAAMRDVIRRHFADISQDDAHHKTARGFGVAPTGVYEEAARRTGDPQVEEDGVSVTIDQVAIAQRFYGGDIHPVEHMFLTIPARAEAYGKRATEFDNLRFILFPSGAGALVDKNAPRGASIGEIVYYWLVKHVTQDPDPTVLPDDEDIVKAASNAGGDYIERLWDQLGKS